MAPVAMACIAILPSAVASTGPAITGTAHASALIWHSSRKDDYAVFFSTNPGNTVSAVLKYVEAQKDTLIDLRVERPTLEERFLEITDIRKSK